MLATHLLTRGFPHSYCEFMKILIVEDEQHLADGLQFNLEADGFEVETAYNGEEALQYIENNVFDAIVLDVMMPKMNGFEVAKRMRDAENFTPILMLTALGKPEDVLSGFEAGADDYLPKPFNPRELAARIRAILRRVQSAEDEHELPEKFKIDDLEVSTSGRSARRDGEDLQLTSVEFDLLVALLREAGKIVKKEDLSRTVLERELSPFDRSLDMHISNLRKKLGKREGENDDDRIKTIRSVGYIYTVL